MKHILRKIFANSLGIYLATMVGALALRGDYVETLALSAAALTGLTLALKPILSLFLMPINILSLGLVSWVIKLINIYVVSFIVPGFEPVPFAFGGASFVGVNIPAFSGGKFLALVVIMITVGIAGKIVSWIGD